MRSHAGFVASLLFLPALSLGAQASVAGTVTDSLTKRPLAGALVQIAADSGSFVRTATADSIGAFRIDSVRPGRYIIGFFDPALDSIGIDLLPRRIAVRPGETEHVDLAIPAAPTLVSHLCHPAPNDSTGLLVGHIRDADSHMPRTGSVTVQWWEIIIGQGGVHRSRQQIPVKSDALGWYALCGLPSDGELTTSATAGDEESGLVLVHVPSRGLLIRDFLVSKADSTVTIYEDSSAAQKVAVTTLRRGSARVSGAVRSDKGKTVANADVSVPGTGIETRTADAGTFSLSGLPVGTQSVEVRALGFEPKRVAVDLGRDSLTKLDLVLDRPVQTLDAVKIYGQGSASMADFLRRARNGFGHVLTAQDIQRRNALETTDLFRTIPGVRVMPTRGFGNAVTLRGGCTPTVYMNGMRLSDDAATEIDELAMPGEITAIEVYNTAGRPPQFWGNACGSVVLWVGMVPR